MTRLTVVVALFAVAFGIVLYPQPQFQYDIRELAAEYVVRSNPAGALNLNTVKTNPLNNVVVVITGGTSGLGLSVTKTLHSLGATMVVIGRSPKKLSWLQSELDGDNNSKPRIVPIQANLNDLRSVSAAANEIIANNPHIHFLINNAGVHPLQLKSHVSVQGYDETFTVNYLSHFLLTEKLLPILEKSPHEARIIQVSSAMAWGSDGTDLLIGTDDKANANIAPLASRGDSPLLRRKRRGYSNTKLAQILHARKLGRVLGDQNSSTKVVSICPTWVGTSMTVLMGLFAFPADGVGISSILNGLFRPGLGSAERDFVANCHFKWILNLVPYLPFRPVVTFWGGIAIVLPIQKFFYGDFILERTSPESYDIQSQDDLYAWLKTQIEKWI
mmetsp:Transcript_3833/g.4421  ORF Transcript_3833/g.4421 Transcript_3833/m.4421 type:complete len:387 (+) Transcript_3833:134-1294(+)